MATGRCITPKAVGGWSPAAGALLPTELALEGSAEGALEGALEESLEDTLENAEPAMLEAAELGLELCAEAGLEEAAEGTVNMVDVLPGLLEAVDGLYATLLAGVAIGVKPRLLLPPSPPAVEVDMECDFLGRWVSPE